MTRAKVDLLLLQKDHTWDKEEWFLPLAAALEGVGPKEASWQPPGGGNSIWQTLSHLTYYNERVLLRLNGKTPEEGQLDNLSTFAGPGDPGDAAGWQHLLDRTRRAAEGLRQTIDAMSDEDLDKNLGPWTPAQVLPHLLLHDAYHTGQIVLLRKMQASWPAQRG